jgi:lysophospholipase L1-like esterase
MRKISLHGRIAVAAVAAFFIFSCVQRPQDTEEKTRQPESASYELSGNARFDAVLERAAAVGDCEVLVVGDSLVEGLHDNYSDKAVFAAGVRGSGTADWTAYTPLLLRVITPKKIILALGVNDSPRLSPDKLPDFFRRYEEVCRRLSRGTPKLAVSTMLPVRPGGGKKRAAAGIDPAVLRRMNAGIVNIARAGGYEVIDSFAAVADRSGMLPQPLTFDGIHLTRAGYERWEKILFSGWSRPAEKEPAAE